MPLFFSFLPCQWMAPLGFGLSPPLSLAPSLALAAGGVGCARLGGDGTAPAPPPHPSGLKLNGMPPPGMPPGIGIGMPPPGMPPGIGIGMPPPGMPPGMGMAGIPGRAGKGTGMAGIGIPGMP
uniref:Uncharacterized protein n=1 Tax=Triticum urartu TaxID=4572 RepID=A0A8R7UPG1_TRIUA